MYKVMITQIIKNEVVGKSVLVEDFNHMNDAVQAADEYSEIYDRQVYQIREYDDKKSNLISFDEHDTGKIVYEKQFSIPLAYRTEQLYGEGYRDAAAVMAHEVFELTNTDILDTLSETLFKDTALGAELKHMSDVVSGEEEDEDLDGFLDDAFENEEIGIEYFNKVLDEIKKATGKEIRYALWLCDSIEDIKKEYECDEIDVKLTLFDAYETSDIILSDTGTDGKLYGYEKMPVPIG